MFLKQRLYAAEKIFRTTKKPISIAFLDTGISPVADFTQPENRIIAFLDLVNGKTKPYDDNGHGTHVTGFCGNEKGSDMKSCQILFAFLKLRIKDMPDELL